MVSIWTIGEVVRKVQNFAQVCKNLAGSESGEKSAILHFFHQVVRINVYATGGELAGRAVGG